MYRIWDNFFLEGEIFMFKTAIGILKYYELELKMDSFAEALEFLRKLPNDLCEPHLFKIISKLKVIL